MMDDAPGGEQANALVVDDDQVLAELLAIMLRRQGLIPMIAVDAASAFRAFDDHPDIGVLVCDLELGRDNGVDVIRGLRERAPELITVLVSGHTEAVVNDALDGDDIKFMQKPFPPSELIDFVTSR